MHPSQHQRESSFEGAKHVAKHRFNLLGCFSIKWITMCRSLSHYFASTSELPGFVRIERGGSANLCTTGVSQNRSNEAYSPLRVLRLLHAVTALLQAFSYGSMHRDRIRSKRIGCLVLILPRLSRNFTGAARAVRIHGNCQHSGEEASYIAGKPASQSQT